MRLFLVDYERKTLFLVVKITKIYLAGNKKWVKLLLKNSQTEKKQ